VKGELELGDHAEVRSSTADGKEQLSCQLWPFERTLIVYAIYVASW